MAIIFGPHWQRGLWDSPYSLMFELNQGGSHVHMFTSAFDRARRLARAALPAEQVVAVVAANPEPSKELRAKRGGWTRHTTSYDVLHKMGVPTIPWEATWVGYPGLEENFEGPPWEHRAVRLSWDQADILLWSNIAYDIGVWPVAPVLSMLVDVERAVAVNAYDDRGMAITALTLDPIVRLYTEFDAWLNDYHRDRMAQVFATKA